MSEYLKKEVVKLAKEISRRDALIQRLLYKTMKLDAELSVARDRSLEAQKVANEALIEVKAMQRSTHTIIREGVTGVEYADVDKINGRQEPAPGDDDLGDDIVDPEARRTMAQFFGGYTEPLDDTRE